MDLIMKSWDANAYGELVSILEEKADVKYKAFQESLIPGTENILGVRTPELRSIARQIAKGDWRGCLKAAADGSFEETLLQGMVIGYAKTGIDEKLALIEEFVPKINNWAVCDGFCSGLKFPEEDRARVFEFLQRFLASRDEYSVRFAVVMMMQFIDSEYIGRVLQIISEVDHEGYYVKMAAAWVLAECFVKFGEKTLALLQSGRIDEFTRGKALQKIIESKRVDDATRVAIRSMR
jgi:3-methyladenine DNA glycosylase AlkD